MAIRSLEALAERLADKWLDRVLPADMFDVWDDDEDDDPTQ